MSESSTPASALVAGFAPAEAGFDCPALDLDAAVVAEARALAGQIAAEVDAFAVQHTTIAMERTVLRLFGVAGATADGEPLVSAVVRRPCSTDRADPGSFLLKLIGRPRGHIGERGTPRQQDNLGRRMDKLIAGGVVRPPRDLALLHEALRWRGLARPLGDPQPAASAPAINDLERTTAAVRRLFQSGRAPL